MQGPSTRMGRWVCGRSAPVAHCSLLRLKVLFAILPQNGQHLLGEAVHFHGMVEDLCAQIRSWGIGRALLYQFVDDSDRGVFRMNDLLPNWIGYVDLLRQIVFKFAADVLKQ